jgi:predicted nicotinamide N-methyase
MVCRLILSLVLYMSIQHIIADPCIGTPSELELRLVGSHPLWAHYLWNAAKVDENKDLCRNKSVLELGAGAALPSIIASANGATKTVVTDYPDQELIDNIEYNIKSNLPTQCENQSICAKVCYSLVG